jgi:uroporphyrinogen decarboxylase
MQQSASHRIEVAGTLAVPMNTRQIRDPDINQLLKVLGREQPERPTLFEFFHNDDLYTSLAGRPRPDMVPRDGSPASYERYREIGRWYADAFLASGYDYINVPARISAPEMRYRASSHEEAESHSLNDQPLITNREELDRYEWPQATDVDAEYLDALLSVLPEGMGGLTFSPGGELENLVDLTGYDNLCFMLVDDRDLVADITARLGDSLMSFFRMVADHPRTSAVIVNDDWGFNTQTMISPADLREFIYPTHAEAVRLAHAAGKKAILHSCGNLAEVFADIPGVLGFDAKHSYEDAIQPVEDFYEQWHEKIAILGGIDVDYLCTHSPEEITARARGLLELSAGRGGYALGSGNSIPVYVPTESFFAMTRAALE